MKNKLTYKNFLSIINKNFLFENCPYIAVAVSGGPDSIALVFLLQKWIVNKKGKLFALIVDHQIRKNSNLEAKKIKEYLSSFKIKALIIKVSKKNVVNKNMKEARINRYSKIIKYCKKNNIFHLFFGHHSDDNLETFVLRKIAGSNLEGLNSIREKSINNNLMILRPLLGYTKKQIIDFNNKNNYKFINDPTNDNENYSRVYVRNFLKKNLKNNNEFKKEFHLVKKSFFGYKKMITQILLLITLSINTSKITVDLKKFLNLDIEIQAKIIEMIYKFFNLKKPFIRYSKIKFFLKNIGNNTNFDGNLTSMKVKADNKYIYFLYK